ncbi:prolipoprotein diacylglyceryl transferase family protein [Aquimarina sp. 2304DJ70-9]|uniref:prolipoprotein diacylglyceryl transferase family protein n=1 Tax=Aquimarina penaris TaxID=3231044 RepID=UPI003462DDCE
MSVSISKSFTLTPPLQLNIGNRRWTSFVLYFSIGFVFALVYACVLVVMLESLSLWINVILLGISLIGTLLFYYVHYIIVGNRILTFFRYQLFLIFFNTIILYSINENILSHLDIIILSIAVIQAWGRIGCLHAGCCYGIPCDCRFKIQYAKEHIKSGFPDYLIGVPLFPIQLVESIGVFLIISFLTIEMLYSYIPGEAGMTYLVMYAMLRFFLELRRADTQRSYWMSLSEAQWVSIFTCTTVCILSVLNLVQIPNYVFWLTAILLVVSTILIISRYVRNPKSFLLHPFHIKEIDRLIKNTYDKCLNEKEFPTCCKIESTSQGINYSYEKLEKDSSVYFIFSFSSNTHKMPDIFIKTLMKMIQNIFREYGFFSCKTPKKDVFQFVFLKYN